MSNDLLLSPAVVILPGFFVYIWEFLSYIISLIHLCDRFDSFDQSHKHGPVYKSVFKTIVTKYEKPLFTEKVFLKV